MRKNKKSSKRMMIMALGMSSAVNRIRSYDLTKSIFEKTDVSFKVAAKSQMCSDE